MQKDFITLKQNKTMKRVNRNVEKCTLQWVCNIRHWNNGRCSYKRCFNG